MIELIKNQYAPDSVSPPGETLLETLESRGMSQAELANRTGRPTKTINEIIRGKAAITPETAIQLELVLGVPASFWNEREKQYREHLAQARSAEWLVSQTEWLDTIPCREMIRAGWIPPSSDKGQLLHNVLMFFGVASPSAWNQVWGTHNASFRQSHRFAFDEAAVAAWLRKGEIEAQQIQSEPFDASLFRQALNDVRLLTRELSPNFAQKLVDRCSSVGVRVVFVPELPRTRVWGAARWLTPTCALIQLSLRYRTDDHLWFTFFHEAGHVLLHGKRNQHIDHDDQGSSNIESEADTFAQNWLIPESSYKAFKRRGAVSCGAISRFAHEIGIAAGIVVGRLQREQLLPRTHCNDLKKSLAWAGDGK